MLMMMLNLVILESFRRRDGEQVHAVPRQGAAQQSLMLVVMYVILMMLGPSLMIMLKMLLKMTMIDIAKHSDRFLVLKVQNDV